MNYPVINMTATGMNIKNMMKKNGCRVTAVAELLGMSDKSAIYKWFRGESIPAIETMLILCNALGIEIKELLVIDGDFNFLCYNTHVRYSLLFRRTYR